ncbi:MAG: response regulator, partial [Leptolyngbya sp.]|nr:response regulator [Candidatus Melainabacteria bacterium]
EELDRAKTIFFSNISHEFRTPLTLMLGPIESMINNATDNEHKKELEIVQRNAQRLLKLVNTLLDFSRIESSRFEARYEPTLLGEYVIDLASLFRSAIETAGLEFEVIGLDDGEKAYVDREMWEQIVFNLLSNAFKFTITGKITIALRKIGANFELSVKDTGIGIPEEQLENIFKRFHRLKAEGARTYEGSGIGLAMVNELVQLHGGNLRVKSGKGKGTEFIASIPKGKSHLPEDQLVEERKLAVNLRQASPFLQEANSWLQTSVDDNSDQSILLDEQTPSIIVADDNADMREYIRRLLAPFYEVRFASNGRDALKMLKDRIADLLISDIMMPEMDGLELLSAIRQSETLKNMPVLLVSARAGDEARASGIEAGADEYIVKPFSVRELHARVTRLLQKHQFSQSLELAIQKKTEQIRLEIEAKSQFLSTVGHEVRSPISGIIGVMDIIHDNPNLDAESRELVDVALDSSKRLLLILNDLLDSSKLSAGSLTLERRIFEPRPIISDVVHLVKPEASKKGVEIISSVSSDVPEILCGDELRLRQIIQNLVFNAIKFTSKGSIEIMVENLNGAEDDVMLKFIVKDSGIGITPEEQTKIFEPFVQAADSTTRVYGGTGLGLNICRTLVKLMDGEILVDSEIGKGSTFSAIIPFRRSACSIE